MTWELSDTPTTSIKDYLTNYMNKLGLSGDVQTALHQLADYESGLNPIAKNPKSSATGVFQFINSTGASEGLNISKGSNDERLNAIKNVEAGVNHFVKNLEGTGSIEGAIKAHYNSGSPQEDERFLRAVTKAGKVAAVVSPQWGLSDVSPIENQPADWQLSTVEPTISSREALTDWNTKASPEFKLLKRTMQEGDTQATTNLTNLIAGPAGETNLPEALHYANLPFAPLTYALKKLHGAVIEPGRVGTEAEASRFIQEPGVGTAAPEAFAPLPTEGAFVPTMELALLPAYTKLLSKIMPVGKVIDTIASKMPETKHLGTTEVLASLADRGVMENKVMDFLMKGRELPRPTPLSPAATSGLQYGEGFGNLGGYPKWYGEEAARAAATENIISRFGKEKSWEDIVAKVQDQRAYDFAKGTEGTPFVSKMPPTEIPATTPMANQALLEGLGVPRGPLLDELFQSALGSGDTESAYTRLLDALKKGTIAGGAGAFLSSLVGPKEAEAGVMPTVMLDALTEVASVAKGKTGRQFIESMAEVASKKGIDVGKLGEAYKFLDQSGGLEGLLEKAIQPKPAFVVPPATTAPTSIMEVANELVGTRKPTKGQVDIPDALGTTKLDSKIPTWEGDMNRIDLERSPNIVSSNYMGPENNLVGDYAQATTTFNNNMPAVSRIFDNITKKLGLKADISESEKAVNETIGPLFEQWRGVVKDEVRLEALIKSEKKYLAEFDPMSVEATAAKDKIATLTDTLAQTKAVNEPVVIGLRQQRQVLLEDLGAKYANVRIKSAAEGQEWAQKLIQPGEQLAVDQTRKYLDLTKKNMTDLGMKTFESPTKDYVPYIYQTGEYGDTGKRYFAEKLWYNKKDKPNQEWLDFMSRQPGSGDWYPLWKQSMEAYIPTVERSMAFNPFLRKWTPAIHEWRVGEKPMTAEWASGFINRNMSPESTNIVMQGLNKLTNLEYFHYLAGSVSTAFLHLFKLIQTPIWHGFIPTVKAAGSMIKAAVDPASTERALYHNYVQARMLTRALAQEPGMSTFLEPKWWKGLLDKGLQNPITNPTRMIEAFDNGMNMFAALHSGLAKGASAATMNRAVLESQMLLNFRGFAMPRVTTQPGTRALLMFQATPFKLAENKLDLVMKALTGKTDIYGRSDMNKLIRLVTLTGLTLGIGETLGVDLFKHAGLHLPFTSETPTGEIAPAVPPFVKYGAAAASGGFAAGAKSALSYWGPVQKTLESYIPEKYSESKVQQILGVPTKGWAEAGQAQKEMQEVQHLRAKQTLEARKPARVETPYEFLLGLIGGGD